MDKYIIEGGVNFYEELYKSLDDKETNEKTVEDNNLCLITNQPLIDKAIQMNCGHKFNYIPLYFDLKNHKQKFNGMEGSSGRLSIDEIRCPYCRTKQKGVLPYYEDLKLAKINGVNDINPYSSKLTTNYKKCSYKSLNPNYDPSGNNPVETADYNTGNCKYHTCLCIGHFTLSIDNGNTYCWTHKKAVVKKMKEESKEKLKEEAKKAKEEAKKVKEEAKKAIQEAKLKAKEEAKKIKEEAKKTKSIIPENIVLGQLDLSGNLINTGCVEILKTGKNKGNQCGCKINIDNLCIRHFKIKNGIVMNNI